MLRATGIILLATLNAGAAPQAPPTPSAGLREELRAIRKAEADRLERLAEGLAGPEAAEVRARVEPEPPKDGPTRFSPLPEVVPAPPAPPATEASWRAEARAARDSAASALFALAGRSAKIGRFALADECLRGTIARRPGHAEARRLLGYVPLDGGWATPHAAKKLRDGWVSHPTFGWVEAAWVPHLDRGELPALGFPIRWVPADEADAQRREFADAWTIETAHFVIRSNVPLSAVIGFARRLEAFHDAFFSLMADVIGRDLPLARRYRGDAATRPPSRKHRIWYFGSQAEYVAHLRPRYGPAVEGELGLYDRPAKSANGGISYFFRGEGPDAGEIATLYHETSHQLLFETAGRESWEENAGNYWVFEGLGTYFETVTVLPDGSLEIGGLVGPRIKKARDDLLTRGDFVPIADLVAMDRRSFNDDRAIHRHYAEAMALAVFLMQSDRARHREAFLDYVRDAYKGQLRRGTGRSLEGRLGVPSAQLDRDFLSFLREGTREVTSK